MLEINGFHTTGTRARLQCLLYLILSVVLYLRRFSANPPALIANGLPDTNDPNRGAPVEAERRWRSLALVLPLRTIAGRGLISGTKKRS